MPKDQQLEIKIENDVLTISIGTDILCHATEYGLETRGLEIADRNQFLRDLVAELGAEMEDGTTSVHKMIDQAAYQAAENGSEAFEDSY